MKYRWLAVLLFLIGVALICTIILYERKSDPAPALESYNGSLTVRITGPAAQQYGDEDMAELQDFAEAAGELLYNLGENRTPETMANVFLDVTPQDLFSLSTAHQVKSELLGTTVLDIKAEESSVCDLLVCYRLDFQSSQIGRGEYLFLLNLTALRQEDGWRCTEMDIRGYAPAAVYTLIRDDITGKIMLKLIQEGE